MKNIIIGFVAGCLVAGTTAAILPMLSGGTGATTAVSWKKNGAVISPLYSGDTIAVSGAATSTFSGDIYGKLVSATYFNATSSAATSTLQGLKLLTGGFQISTMKNCNTIDTDASGNFSCGSDETGAGTASPFESSTSWGALAQATTSLLAFPQGLISSSTVGKMTVGTFEATSTSNFIGATTGISLDEIENPTTDKTFTMAANNLTFNFTTPSSGLELNATGAFSDHVLHVHQSSGNPGAGTELLHLEATDVDVLGIGIDMPSATADAINVRTGETWLQGTLISSSTIGRLTVGSLTATSTVTVPAGSIAVAALAASTISGVTLGGNLSALTNDATLNGSSYNGSAAVSDWGLNLANANTWTGKQTFYDWTGTNGTSTSMFYGVQAYLASSSVGKLTVGVLSATSTATSTFVGGISTLAVSSTATSSSKGLVIASGGLLNAPFTHSILLSATTTMGTGTTTYKFSGFGQAFSITELGCLNTNTGTFVVQIGDGSASTTAIKSAAGGNTTTFTALSSNNSFTRGEAFFIAWGSVSGTVEKPTCSYTRVTQ